MSGTMSDTKMAKVPLQSSRSVSAAEEVRHEQKQVMLEEEQDLSPRRSTDRAECAGDAQNAL